VRRRPTLIVALAAAVVTFTVGAALIPRPPALSEQTSGDPALVERVRELVAESPGVRDRLSVAVIDGDGTTTAHFGATDATEYEIGSVTKTVTGSLLADAIERGEVEATTPLDELLDVGTGPVASVTLEQLATQSSGLPRLAGGAGTLLKSIVAQYRASDPYGATVEELERQAREVELGDPGFLYSNFGFALLGQALAAAAGTDYGSLAADDSYAPDSVDDLRDDAPTGFTASGRPAGAWTLGADSPAGSVRSTTADLERYLRAQLDGSAPGAAATGPRAPVGEGEEIGYAWFTTEDGVTWHNGGTGGFTSWIGFDRESGRAVIVLNGTTTTVDDLGFALMEED
jgi:CubicO group peptidase (beta-lactamase class C family)